MSWQAPRRPKTKRPWPPIDTRVLPQNYKGDGAIFKAYFAESTRRATDFFFAESTRRAGFAHIVDPPP